MSRQRGSAGVLVVGVVAALVLVTAGMLLVLQHSVQRHRVMAATDAAALHAADALRGIVPGQPCRAAAAVLQGQGVRLVECRIRGFDVLIQAEAEGGLQAVRARARAGNVGVD